VLGKFHLNEIRYFFVTFDKQGSTSHQLLTRLKHILKKLEYATDFNRSTQGNVHRKKVKNGISTMYGCHKCHFMAWLPLSCIVFYHCVAFDLILLL